MVLEVKDKLYRIQGKVTSDRRNIKWEKSRKKIIMA